MTLILVISVTSLILSIGLKRYKIIVTGDNIVETPILGKSKQIKFEEIENFQIRRSKSIILLGGKKKIYIDPAVPEYKQIYSILYNRGFIQTTSSEL